MCRILLLPLGFAERRMPIIDKQGQTHKFLNSKNIDNIKTMKSNFNFNFYFYQDELFLDQLNNYQKILYKSFAL